MPMIDIYATAGTFADKHQLAQDLARAVMRWEGVPTIPLFSDNTAAFVHHLPPGAISNATGEANYVRVQVLTPVGVRGPIERAAAGLVERAGAHPWHSPEC